MLALGAALSIAVPAQAGVSQDFRQCDGLKKPKRSNDGMRGEATIPSRGAFTGGGNPTPDRTIVACTAAIDSGKIREEQNMRLAHVLRARAAAYIAKGDYAEAIADLDRADAATASYVGDFFYDRSMGASLKLLRAIVVHESGDKEQAKSLAREASQLRPYSIQVQRVAASVMRVDDPDAGDEAELDLLLQIDPQLRERGVLRSKSSITEYVQSAGEPELTLPPIKAPQVQILGTILPGAIGRDMPLPNWTSPVREAMTTAYALTASGDHEAAKAWMTSVSNRLDEAMREPEETGDIDAPVKTEGEEPEELSKEEQSALRAQKRAGRDKETLARLEMLLAQRARVRAYEPLVVLIDARKAIDEGRLSDAAQLVKPYGFTSTLVTRDLHEAYNAARSAAADDSIPMLRELAPPRASRRPSLKSLAANVLIKPEEERKLINYKKSRPNILGALVGAAVSMGTTLLQGIDKTDGFSSEELEDGLIKVEYTGNSTSGPVVQEMTLLRAAEIAREGSATHFRVEGRRDFQRYSVRSQYNIEMERTLVGYKTEMSIRLLGPEDATDNALEAVQVIDDLGSIYYRDKAG